MSTGSVEYFLGGGIVHTQGYNEMSHSFVVLFIIQNMSRRLVYFMYNHCKKLIDYQLCWVNYWLL